jgi:hypothetical protein
VSARESALLQSGLQPIDYLCSVYQNENEPTSVRVSAAQTVCQFIYPKLSSVDVNAASGQPLIVQVLRFSDAPELPALPPGGPVIEVLMAGSESDAVAAPAAAALDNEDDTT